MSPPTFRETILVVDDTPDSLEVIHRNLTSQGYKVLTCSSALDAINILEQTTIDLVITDYKMPGVSGMDLVRHIRENYKDTEVMMITGYATIEGAVKAVKVGAEEYLAKPFTDKELLQTVRNVLEKLARRRTSSELSKLASEGPAGLIGKSKAMRKVFIAIDKTASNTATVLITGENGTGKELVARAIHYRSKRASGPFVPVNCGGIPEGLLESELFGHVKGAFTGAIESRAGFFQTAEGGSIFLDEIGELSIAMQVKLLRVLQDKEVCMIGVSRSRKVNVRIIAATNKDLDLMMKKGLFREDLYFRLNVIHLIIPPLRERADDIPMLINYFSQKFAKEFDVPPPVFSDKAIRALGSYDWHGNVRELENLVQRVAVMNEGEIVDLPELPSPMRFSLPRTNGYDKLLEEVEADYIVNVLNNNRGNKTRAAEVLGIDRKTLRQKLKKYGIDS